MGGQCGKKCHRTGKIFRLQTGNEAIFCESNINVLIQGGAETGTDIDTVVNEEE